MRRPTLVSYGSDHQPRLLPLLEVSIEETPDHSDVNVVSNNDDEVESDKDSESLVDSAEYDTDLDVEGQSDYVQYIHDKLFPLINTSVKVLQSISAAIKFRNVFMH